MPFKWYSVIQSTTLLLFCFINNKNHDKWLVIPFGLPLLDLQKNTDLPNNPDIDNDALGVDHIDHKNEFAYFWRLPIFHSLCIHHV